MEKIVILTAGILLIISLVLAIIILTPSLTGLSISNSQNTINPQTTSSSHAWTKAICDKDNLCQDYLIECKGSKPTKISPITGSMIKFDAFWQDPRSLKQKERLC